MFRLPPGASATLVDRLLSKIEFAKHPGDCDLWIAAYNIDGRKHGRRFRGRRPVVQLGGKGTPMVYVAPLMLALSTDGNLRPVNEDGERLYALHSCDCGQDGWYRCVTLSHLRWGTQTENEADKQR